MTKREPFISQVELISGISKVLERHGYKTLLHRQFNAVIQAATDIVTELDKPYQPIVPGGGFALWQRSDETGLSSEFMASWLSGNFNKPVNWPHDADDFGRCVGLLVAVPEFRDKLNKLTEAGPRWAALVARWSELEADYQQWKAGTGGKDLSDKIRQCVGE